MSEETTKNEEIEDVQEAPTDETPAEEEITAEAPATEKAAAEEAPAAEAVAEAEVPVAEVPVAEAVAEAEAPATADEPSATLESLKIGMECKGRVKSIELYGAFVDIGVGKDALLHISQLGKPNVRNVEDVVKKGEEITAYILKVDPANQRVALSLDKPPSRPMGELREGEVVTGKVVRIENFGVFVEIGAERPGMIHVSELATGYVKSPEDVVNIDDEIQAKIIKVNRRKRQIDLSIKALEEERTRKETTAAVSADAEDDEPMPTAMELALRRALDKAQEDSTNDQRVDRRQRTSSKKKQALQDVLSRTLKDHDN